MLFSQRIGKKPVKSIAQVESMDDDLRNGLWDCLTICYWNTTSAWQSYDADYRFKDLTHSLWHHFFKVPMDRIPATVAAVLERIRKYYFTASWESTYDFIEFVAQNYPVIEGNEQFMKMCNCVLEREISAYRFVEGKLAPITAKVEIDDVSLALKISEPLSAVHSHLDAALELIADRKTPDYRNSIKESISAVEAICRLITGTPKATLGEALRRLKDSGVEIHPALEKSFKAMYGYTSDEGGIRHSLLEESTLEFIDAKFMLVTCSSFINLLIDKSARAKVALRS